MPAFNFMRQFADAVESGRKCQTIRLDSPKYRNAKSGNRVVLYTGMRTKGCRKLGESILTRVRPVTRVARGLWKEELPGRTTFWGPAMLETIAKADGFESVEEFEDFFDRYPTPTKLVLFRWEG